MGDPNDMGLSYITWIHHHTCDWITIGVGGWLIFLYQMIRTYRLNQLGKKHTYGLVLGTKDDTEGVIYLYAA